MSTKILGNKKKLVAAISLVLAILFFSSYLSPQKEDDKASLQKTTDIDFALKADLDMPGEKLDDLKEKYDEARVVLEEDSLNYDANLVKADVLFQVNEFDKATIIYKQLIELDPTDIRPLEALGNIYRLQDNYGESEKMYLKAIENDPKSLSAYMGLAMMYSYEKNDDKEKIKRFYEGGISSLGSDKYDLIYSYATYLRDIEEYEKAIEQWNVYLTEYPDDKDVIDQVAELQAKLAPFNEPALVPAQ